MRKVAFSVMVLLSVLTVSILVSASGNVVSGSVYKLKDSKIVSGAEITVVCNNHVEKTSSDYDGSYSVFYSSDECSEGDKVRVTAEKGRLYGRVVETMSDFGLDIDLVIADVFVKKHGNEKPKLQLYGFVDDYDGSVFVHLNNYGKKSDAVLTATLVDTGERYEERLKLKKNGRLLRVFTFDTLKLLPGENVIELFARAGDVSARKYISYSN